MGDFDAEEAARRLLHEKSDFKSLMWIWLFRLGWLPVVVWGIVRLWLWHDDPPLIARRDDLYVAVATIAAGLLMGLIYRLFLRRVRLRILAERGARAVERRRDRAQR